MLNSLSKVDIDLRKSLYNDIVLAGGNTMFEGLPERFLNEMKKLVGKEIKIRVFSPNKRNIMCWSGGSILSKLTYFKNMWISKQEYEEEGNRIIMKKAL
jgi:centractin